MEARQGQRIVLGMLAGVLAVALAWQFWPAGESAAPGASPRSAKAAAARRNAAPETSEVVNVEVSRLEQVPPAIAATGRNPFRYQPKAPVAPPPKPEEPPGGPPVAPAEPLTPPQPPAPPPITLKFIGTLSGEAQTGKVAILSDGKFVYYGREGDIIEGRYRVVKIGEESVQLEHVDGRGRQTIRLSGA